MYAISKLERRKLKGNSRILEPINVYAIVVIY
jgi:hypothetical protein